MAQGLRPFSEYIVITILFGLMLIFFIVGFLGSSNPNAQGLPKNMSYLSGTASSLNSSISSFGALSTQIQGSLIGSTPDPVGFVFLIFKGAFYIPYYFLSSMLTGIVALTSMINQFGGGGIGGIVAIIVSVMAAILLVRLVLYIVSAIRTGVTG